MTAFFEALCRASIFGLAALFVALAAQYLLARRVPAAWRAWVWRVALLQSVFALLPLAPIRWQVLAPPTPATSKTAVVPPAELKVESSEFPRADSPPLEIPDVAPLENAPIESAPPIPIAKAQSSSFDWRALALSIYGLGIAFQCAQLARGALKLRRILNNCMPTENAQLLARLKTLAARLNLKRAPQLLQTASGSPFVTGVWRPRIVLPRALCDADPLQLDAVLAHELAHTKRRDLVWSALLWFAQTLLWFHPLAWAARRFHGLETECACDELALQIAPIAPQSYGALLLNSMNNSPFHSPLAAGTCDTLFALKTRLWRLNNAPTKPRMLAKFAFVASLLLSCGALVPLKLVARAGDALAETKQVEGRAVVQGVVTSKQSGKPLAGVTVILISDRIPQQFVTDARGYFRFNAPKGNYFLGANQISPARTFDLENGQKRDFKLELDETFKSAGKAVVQGIILSPQSMKPLAGAFVVSVSGKELQQSITDGRGSFRFNVDGGKQMVSVTTGETNPRERSKGYIFFDLEDGKTRNVNFDWNKKSKISNTKALTPKVMGSAVVQGVVTSKQTGQPLAGVNVALTAISPGSKTSSKINLDSSTKQEVLTDNRGYFRFNATSGKHLLEVGFMGATTSRFPMFDVQIFTVADLKSRKKYDLKFDIDDKSKRDPNRIPAKLPATRGTGRAVVQGVIVSKQSGQPLAGVPILVMAGNARMTPKQQALAKKARAKNFKSQQTVTDARGYFRFNVAGGVHSLLIDSKLRSDDNVSMDPRRMKVFVAKQVQVVTLGKAEMRNFRFELDKVIGTPIEATTGTVFGPDGQPFAGATVVYHEIGKSLLNIKSDADGRFSIPTEDETVLQMWADADELTTTKSILTKPRNDLKLQLQKGAWSSVSGRVIGAGKRPIAGALVRLRIQSYGSLNERNTQSDADGNFRFERVRPNIKFLIVASKTGYKRALDGVPSPRYRHLQQLEPGKNAEFELGLARENRL